MIYLSWVIWCLVVNRTNNVSTSTKFDYHVLWKCPIENQPQLGCKQPAYISSATVSVRYREQSFFPEGAKVRYMCHGGYEWKEGQPYRTCEGGTWTALQMICERKNIHYLNIHFWSFALILILRQWHWNDENVKVHWINWLMQGKGCQATLIMISSKQLSVTI